MKHLVNGVALAALLAIAAPVWAQNAPQNAPMTPAPAARNAATAMPSASAGMAAAGDTTAQPQRRMRQAAKRSSSRRQAASSDDQRTDDLNRQELQRLQSGGAASGGMTGTRGGASGMPGAGNPQVPPGSGPRPSGR